MNGDPLELFHQWVEGSEVVLATAADDGRPSARMVLLKGADERGFTFFSNYESRKGRELDANPHAALLFHRDGIQVRVEGPVAPRAGRGVRRVLDDTPGRVAPQRRGLEAVRADRLPRGARGGRRRAARGAAAAVPLGRLPARPGALRVLAPPRRPAPRASPVQATRRRVGGATPPTVKACSRRPRSRARGLVAAGAAAPASPTLGGCPVFPLTSPWNERVDTLPVASDSASLIASIGLDSHVHADFGSGLWDGSRIGIPYVVVHGKSTPKSRVAFDMRTRATRARIRSRPTSRSRASREHRRRPARADPRPRQLPPLRAVRAPSPRLRLGGRIGRDLEPALECATPAGWTSADAAGLPILPGLARWDGDASTGAINHALRFTADRTRKAYIWPARHYASSDSNASLPPMGLARPAESGRRHQQASSAGAHRRHRDEAVRDDPRRQRLELVRERCAEPALVERPAARARSATGADFEVVDTSKLRR